MPAWDPCKSGGGSAAGALTVPSSTAESRNSTATHRGRTLSQLEVGAYTGNSLSFTPICCSKSHTHMLSHVLFPIWMAEMLGINSQEDEYWACAVQGGIVRHLHPP